MRKSPFLPIIQINAATSNPCQQFVILHILTEDNQRSFIVINEKTRGSLLILNANTQSHDGNLLYAAAALAPWSGADLPLFA